MAQVPLPPQGYPQPQPPQQQQQQQQLQFQGQQPQGMMNIGTPGTVLPNGQFMPSMNMPGTPGAMNMSIGTPGTVLPNGQFVPNAMPGTPGALNMNMGTPGTAAVLPSGQVVPAPAYSTGGAVYAPSPGGANIGNVGERDPVGAPVITREQQQFVGVPRGMTRESMQPGYDPRLKVQRRVFNPAWSFKDSFGNSRGRNCCTIS